MTTAQISSDIESIKSVIKQALLHRNGVVTSNEGTMRSVQKLLRVACSGERFDKAIGSLIHHGELVRHRPEPLGRGDEDRPLTVRFRQCTGGLEPHRSSFVR